MVLSSLGGGGSVGRRDDDGVIVFPFLLSAALVMVAATKQSLLLFVCSAKLWLTLRNHQRSIRSCHESSDDDDDEEDDDEIIGALAKKSTRPHVHHANANSIPYYRRDTSLDFHPNNSNNNWTHFETYQEQPQKQQQQQQQCTSPSFSSSSPSMDSYTDNLLRGKECHPNNRRSSSSSTMIGPHSNAQRCLPSKLILIRHGQSEGNVDESLYATKPDNAMGLTKLGWEMARMAGKILRGDDKEKKNGLLPPDESVHFIVSPYVRTVETFHGIASAWIDPEEMMDLEEEEEEEEVIKSNGCNHDRNNNNIVGDNTNSISKRSNSRNSNVIKDYNGSYHNTNNCSTFSINNDHSNHHKHNNYNHRRCKRLKAWYEQLMKMGLTWHEDPRIREQDCKYGDGESSWIMPLPYFSPLCIYPLLIDFSVFISLSLSFFIRPK